LALLPALPRLALGTLHILQHAGRGSRTDYAWMYYAMRVAWLALRGRVRPAVLYRLADQRAWMRAEHIPYSRLDLYSYPPPFALAFAPLGALPYAAARTAWTLLSVAWFLGGVAFACGLADRRGDWRVRGLVATVGLACFPALTTLYWGQTDTLILFLLAAGLWCIYRGRRPGVGGALLTLAALFKITPAIIVAFFAVRAAWTWRQRRDPRGGAAARWRRDGTVVLAAGLTVLAAVLITAAALGWGPFVSYVLRVLPQVQRVALAVGPAPMEQSLRGVLLLFVRPGPGLRVAVDALSVAAPALLFALDLRRPGGDPRGEVAAVALLSMVSAPSLEGHHFVVAALPEVVLGGWLLQQRRGRPPWAAWAAYALAVLLLTVPGYPFLPRIGRPLCAATGRTAWVTGGHLFLLACDGQHLWSVLLLFGVALMAVWARPRGANGARRARRRLALRRLRRAAVAAPGAVGPVWAHDRPSPAPADAPPP
jgi:uncharacterized membrane protein YecN with MAPEG domain